MAVTVCVEVEVNVETEGASVIEDVKVRVVGGDVVTTVVKAVLVVTSVTVEAMKEVVSVVSTILVDITEAVDVAVV